MEKFNVYDWACKVGKDTLSSLGWSQDVIVEGNVWEGARKAFEAGLSVMVCHGDEMPILFVDTQRGNFHQR